MNDELSALEELVLEYLYHQEVLRTPEEIATALNHPLPQVLRAITSLITMGYIESRE